MYEIGGQSSRACVRSFVYANRKRSAAFTEVLQGFGSERDFNRARKLLASVPLIPLVGKDIALQAVRNFRKKHLGLRSAN